ncbi:hypothetical protein AAFC00_003951 [Neodothiora populina]|uniref:histidine kinase n=1 Tax=Neodothiora populina TaxID=2781224 RepID=A0ABR3PI16_9PEZI
MTSSHGVGQAEYRLLEPQWDPALIAVSIGICFLGSFTATQVFCQARMAVHFRAVACWTAMGAILFGFTGIWCLHEVAMLACKFDLEIGIDAPLTALSAVLAIMFTWISLSSDILWDRFQKHRRRQARRSREARKQKKKQMHPYHDDVEDTPSSEPLLESSEDEADGVAANDGHGEAEEGYFDEHVSHAARYQSGDDLVLTPLQPGSAAASPGTNALKPPSHGFNYNDAGSGDATSRSGMSSASKAWLHPSRPHMQDFDARSPMRSVSEAEVTETGTRTSSDWSSLRRDSSVGGSSSGYLGGLNSAIGMVYRRGETTGWAVITLAKAFWAGCTTVNIFKGFVWSLAIDTMHYVGIAALRIPNGYYTLNPLLVLSSALISWIVCLVGSILMANMETHLGQQLLFSVVATIGVNGMHHVGMIAATFWSKQATTEQRGYPPALANSVIGVAGVTCVIANLLLTYSATASRNKLAEIVWTRKELWKAIAQKENAEAAALARSEFVASASHEIRTPLHHLQGYSDLLSQQELTEEGRALLCSIQRATKTLSMITTNVLDWSKLERNAEAAYRPVALDIREVCESIIALLPNIDDEATVEVFLVVSPDVPQTVFMDESYIHRIFMNLLSNALKFTSSGYIMLTVRVAGDKLVAEVRDTGVGIDPEFLPRLFEPFEQGEVRGKQRGSGLGLAIIRELVQKMSGTIEVQSDFRDEMDDSSPSGSVFTLTLPLQTTSLYMESTKRPGTRRVGLLVHDDVSVYTQGLQLSWRLFGYETYIAQGLAGLPDVELDYIWADAEFLRKHTPQYNLLMQRTSTLVLVPSNSQDTLQELQGVQRAAHCIVLQKPLIWHLFEKRIKHKQQSPVDKVMTKTLRFAPEVEVMPTLIPDDDRSRKLETPRLTVLVVEDNPINQKLAKKMLAALNYDVLVADDGQAGIDELIKHDATIDVIIMDESMPRKSGTQATKEIRELELSGVLTRRRPIIAVTAVVNPKAQQQFREAGADDFLAKPLSLSKLKDTLANRLHHT